MELSTGRFLSNRERVPMWTQHKARMEVDKRDDSSDSDSDSDSDSGNFFINCTDSEMVIWKLPYQFGCKPKNVTVDVICVGYPTTNPDLGISIRHRPFLVMTRNFSKIIVLYVHIKVNKKESHYIML